MMKIKILFFGIARDISGKGSTEISLNEPISLEGLKILLESKYPKFSVINEFTLAVNEAYAHEDYQLNNGDVVAIIPPVSGG